MISIMFLSSRMRPSAFLAPNSALRTVCGCAAQQDGGLHYIPESGSRCWGFHPLEGIRGAETRWKMAVRRLRRESAGVGVFNVPSCPLHPSLFPLTSQLILYSANRGSHRAGRASWIQMPASDAINTFGMSLIRSCCRETASSGEVPVSVIAKVVWHTYQIRLL